MTAHPINLAAMAKKMTKPWSPATLARVNDYAVIFAKFEGEYPGGFHRHEYDEMFLVHEGEIVIQMEGGSALTLKAGEIGVVPKGVMHCPKSEGVSFVLMFEPAA